MASDDQSFPGHTRIYEPSQSHTMRCRERSEAYTSKCLNEVKGNIASDSVAYSEGCYECFVGN